VRLGCADKAKAVSVLAFLFRLIFAKHNCWISPRLNIQTPLLRRMGPQLFDSTLKDLSFDMTTSPSVEPSQGLLIQFYCQF